MSEPLVVGEVCREADGKIFTTPVDDAIDDD